MTVRTNLNTFRRMTAAEEAVMRAMMPRTSAADPTPLAFRAFDGAVNTRRSVRTITAPLTFKLSEVVR